MKNDCQNHTEIVESLFWNICGLTYKGQIFIASTAWNGDEDLFFTIVSHTPIAKAVPPPHYVLKYEKMCIWQGRQKLPLSFSEYTNGD